MSATISFTFPLNAAYDDVIVAIDKHYGAVHTKNGYTLTGVGDDAPDVGQRNPQEVFTGVPSQPAATYTGQPVGTSAAASAVAGQVDKEGLPWDERIHSSSQKMTDKGVWTRRKNVPEPTYAAIRAELVARAVGAAPVTHQQAPAIGPNAAAANAMHQQIAEQNSRVQLVHAAYATATGQLGPYPGTEANFIALKESKPTPMTLTPNEISYFSAWENLVKAILNPQTPQIPQTAPQTGYVPPVGGNVAAHPATAGQSPAAGATFDPNSYAGFAIFINNAIKAGRITMDQVNGVIQTAGVVDAGGNSNLAAVGANVHAIPGIYGLLEAFYQLSYS